MTGGQSALRRGASWIQDITEIRQAAGMNGPILMRVLVWIWVLHAPSRSLRFQDGPGTITFFQIVSDLHACTGGGSGLRAEFDFGTGLITVDRNAADIHVHGADIQGANGGQVLQDAGADGVLIVGLFLASVGEEEGYEKQCGCERSFHKQFHFSPLQCIAHEKGDANMNNGEDCESVTEGPVDNVPELKDALRSAEKGDALGQ